MSDNVPPQEDIDVSAARRNGRVLVALVVVLVVVAAGVGLVVGALRSHRHGSHGGGLAAVLAVVAPLVVIAILAPVLLRIYRRPAYARVLQYGWVRRMRVGRALRRNRPIAPVDRPVAAAIARTTRQQWWLPYLFGGLLLLWIVQAVTQHGFQRWLGVGLGALYVVLVPLIIRQRRQILANYDRLASSWETAPDPPA